MHPTCAGCARERAGDFYTILRNDLVVVFRAKRVCEGSLLRPR